MEFRPARDAAELEAAWALEGRVFGLELATARRRECELFDPGRPADMIVATGDDGVVALARLVPRTLLLPGSALPTAGLTHVCVAPEHQGLSLGRRVVEAALAAAVARGFALAATIARRAVDGFYPRFGFLGVDAFPEQLVRAGEPAPAGVSAAVGPEDTRPLAALYAAAYGGQGFSFRRDARWWTLLRQRLSLRLPTMRLVALYHDGRVIGYALLDGEIVREAASRPVNAERCVSFLLSPAFAAGAERAFRLPPGHPWLPALARRAHTFSTRAAWDGGHLVRVLDTKRFFSALARASRKDAAVLKKLAANNGPEALAHCLGTCLVARCKLPAPSLPFSLRPHWGPLDAF